MSFGKGYPVYHSMYDDFIWLKKFGDPMFHRHRAAASIWGLVALHLADEFLPFNYLSYVNELQQEKFDNTTALSAFVLLLGEIGSRKRDVSVDESIVTEQSRRSGGRKRRNASASEDESSKLVFTNSGNDMNYRDAKCLKGSGSGDENGESKPEIEASSAVSEKPAKQSVQSSGPPKQDYIHVRARRGQATDSHSLAERVIAL